MSAIVKRHLIFASTTFKPRRVVCEQGQQDNQAMVYDDKENERARRNLIAERLSLAIAGKPRGTQAALARHCGVGPQDVLEWKKTGKVATKHWFAIAEFLGGSVQHLFLVDSRLQPVFGDHSLPSPPPKTEEPRHTYSTSADGAAPFPVHDLPVLTGDQIKMGMRDSGTRSRVYSGTAGAGSFVFVAPDDMMAGGDKPIAIGYHCVVDPTLAPRPGRIVLVRVSGGRPFLRKLLDDGTELVLVAEDPRIKPREVSPDVEIIGTIRTAYYPPEEDD